MSLSTLVNRPATIVRRTNEGDEDDYGNALPTESLIDTTIELQQIRRDEPNAEGEFSETRWLAIFPAGTDLDTGDAVLVDAHEYELEGEPWAARNPRTGTESHVEATLCRAAGAEDVS